jgi:hypothetical protein
VTKARFLLYFLEKWHDWNCSKAVLLPVHAEIPQHLKHLFASQYEHTDNARGTATLIDQELLDGTSRAERCNARNLLHTSNMAAQSVLLKSPLPPPRSQLRECHRELENARLKVKLTHKKILTQHLKLRTRHHQLHSYFTSNNNNNGARK